MNPRRLNRKLAWVVLGVVVAVNACLLTWMSPLYSPGTVKVHQPSSSFEHPYPYPRPSPAMRKLVKNLPGGNNFGPMYLVTRWQTFPWLPGENFFYEEITLEEYEELTRHSKP